MIFFLIKIIRVYMLTISTPEDVYRDLKPTSLDSYEYIFSNYDLDLK